MQRKGLFHLNRSRLEGLEQITMAPEKVLQNVGQLTPHRERIEGQHSVHNMVGARFVRRIEVARLGRRLEGTNYNSRWIRAQEKRLPVKECAV
jgi:hypothetical protein